MKTYFAIIIGLLFCNLIYAQNTLRMRTTTGDTYVGDTKVSETPTTTETKTSSAANYFTETVSAVEIEMVYIKAGTFIMGSSFIEVDREDNEIQHHVTLNDYYIGKYEVTFEQYDAFCTATGRGKPSDSGFGRVKRPVINISWDDANAYCEWLCKQTNKTYRLATEAEWEYAARAVASTSPPTGGSVYGNPAPFSTGNNLTTSQANCDGSYPYNNNAVGEYREKTLPVGSFEANAFGLFDMHGNVWEWCSDWYGDYSPEAQTNPTGATTGTRRVNRGGSWYNSAKSCRSAYRSYFPQDYLNNFIGFRIVCTLKPTPVQTTKTNNTPQNLSTEKNTQTISNTNNPQTVSAENTLESQTSLSFSNSKNVSDEIAIKKQTSKESNSIVGNDNTFQVIELVFEHNYFIIKGAEISTKAHIYIYDKWGKLLYENGDYKNDWNGETNNRSIKDGTYVYRIDFTIDSGHTFTKQGNVSVAGPVKASSLMFR